jgi:hypothetical protein
VEQKSPLNLGCAAIHNSISHSFKASDIYTQNSTLQLLMSHTDSFVLKLLNLATKKNFIMKDAILPHGSHSSHGLDLARSWLRLCCENHTCSSKSPRPGFRPTRLIDVAPLGEVAHASQWRLCTNNQEMTTSSYLTLSHCWGSVKTLMLTKSDIEDFKAGFPDAHLPAKFQDAIQVARRLGHRYIWIDSLCIIQDSSEDWHKESMMMQDVYQNSTCTIAASNAKHYDEHFLVKRDPAITVGEVIKLNWIQEPDKSASLWQGSRTGNDSYLVVHDNFFRMSMSRSPLSQRAWCFQELTLSPRVLHFEEEQLFWECGVLKSCEAHPSVWIPSIHDLIEPIMSDMFRNLPETVKNPLNSHRMKLSSMSYWWALVRFYTKGVLTNPGDKLVALAGIAKAFSQQHNLGEYLAGLWREEMPNNLLWRVADSRVVKGKPPHTIIRQQAYRAPSWSWASVDGCITYSLSPGKGSRSYLAEVLDVKVTPLHNDPFGHIAGGYIEIVGYLIKATNKTSVLRTTPGNKDGEVFPKDDRDEFYLEVDPLAPLNELYYLPIFHGKDGWMNGLLLTPYNSDNITPHKFSRVGCFMFGHETIDFLGLREASDGLWIVPSDIGMIKSVVIV